MLARSAVVLSALLWLSPAAAQVFAGCALVAEQPHLVLPSSRALTSSEVDAAVCRDARLVALAQEVETTEKAQIAARSPFVARSPGRDWVRDVRNKCRDNGCLVQAYSARLAALRGDPPSQAAAKPAQVPSASPAVQPMAAKAPSAAPSSTAAPSPAPKATESAAIASAPAPATSAGTPAPAPAPKVATPTPSPPANSRPSEPPAPRPAPEPTPAPSPTLARLKVMGVGLGDTKAPCTPQPTSYQNGLGMPLGVMSTCRIGDDKDSTTFTFGGDGRVVRVYRKQRLTPSDPHVYEVIKAALRFYGTDDLVVQKESDVTWGTAFEIYNGYVRSDQRTGSGLRVFSCGRYNHGCADYEPEPFGYFTVRYELVDQTELRKAQATAAAAVEKAKQKQIGNMKF